MHSSVRFNSFSNSTYFSNYQPGESLFSLKVNYHLPHIGRLPLPTSRALVTFVSLGRPLQRRSKQWQKATALTLMASSGDRMTDQKRSSTALSNVTQSTTLSLMITALSLGLRLLLLYPCLLHRHLVRSPDCFFFDSTSCLSILR